MEAQKPTETQDRGTLEPSPSRCPRCSTLVSGAYKFCPTCAFRLRVDLASEPLPPPARSPWKRGFLILSIVAVILACALVGVILFHPTWLERPPSNESLNPTPTSPGLATPALTADGIADELVELAPLGFAQSFTFSEVPLPDLSDSDRSDIIAQLGSDGLIDAVIWYALRVMKYEVTCGQYAEFIADLESHREKTPEVWRVNDHRPGESRREDVDLFEHIPDPWQEKDALGQPTGWRLNPVDRNLPVTHVSYVDAIGFSEWISARLGIDLVLPYSVEWMRAARAGSAQNLWPWGDKPLAYACNNVAYWGGPGHRLFVHWPYSEPADAKVQGANTDGLYAFAGNVREWTVPHDFQVVRTLAGTRPYLRWIEKPGGISRFYAFGGSFRSAIDDCQVDRSEPFGGRDRSRDDVGFRLVARPQ